MPSVQEMVAATGKAEVPPRYHRPEAMKEAVADSVDAQIPIIDFGRLLDPDASSEESSRLHRACQDWGFFQVSSLPTFPQISCHAHRLISHPDRR